MRKLWIWMNEIFFLQWMKRTVGYISFQTALSRIWTRVVEFISFFNDCFAMNTEYVDFNIRVMCYRMFLVTFLIWMVVCSSYDRLYNDAVIFWWFCYVCPERTWRHRELFFMKKVIVAENLSSCSLPFGYLTDLSFIFIWINRAKVWSLFDL